VTLGVWTLNEGSAQPFGLFFTDFNINFADKTFRAASRVNAAEIQPKTPEKIWWQGKHIPFIHLAGEHRYHLETSRETLFKKELRRRL